MGWLWPVLEKGGPWAVLLALLGLLVWARITDRLLPERAMERMVAGYVETNKNLTTELAFWRAAAMDKDKTIQALVEQNAKLTASNATAAYALDQIMKEAPNRVLEP